MKAFQRDKYVFHGLVNLSNHQNYFAFKCIKSNFSPEIVLVDSAKLIYPFGGKQDQKQYSYVYFNYEDINSIDVTNFMSVEQLSRVNSGNQFFKNLIVNEVKWRSCENRSNRKSLSQDNWIEWINETILEV